MFENFSRELRRLNLDRGVRIPIKLPLDDKGYFGRRCPHRECGSDFKVLFDDWRDKVPDEAAFCPKCGVRSQPEEFNTAAQRRHIVEVGKAYVTDQLNQAFGRAARSTRPRRISGGLIDITMKVSFKAGTRRLTLPPSADEALRQDLTCEQCHCRYSTIGAGYFCPACGHNSPVADFHRTLDMTLKTLDGLDRIKGALTAIHDADAADNFEQQWLENQVEDLVTAFQRVTEALFRKLPNASQFNCDTNLFQRVTDASRLWLSATGIGYEQMLASGEFDTLLIMVQRRHKIGHCQGMVDERYVRQSGDRAYDVGQRLVIRRPQVQGLAEILIKLVDNLLRLVP